MTENDPLPPSLSEDPYTYDRRACLNFAPAQHGRKPRLPPPGARRAAPTPFRVRTRSRSVPRRFWTPFSLLQTTPAVGPRAVSETPSGRNIASALRLPRRSGRLFPAGVLLPRDTSNMI